MVQFRLLSKVSNSSFPVRPTTAVSIKFVLRRVLPRPLLHQIVGRSVLHQCSALGTLWKRAMDPAMHSARCRRVPPTSTALEVQVTRFFASNPTRSTLRVSFLRIKHKTHFCRCQKGTTSGLLVAAKPRARSEQGPDVCM